MDAILSSLLQFGLGGLMCAAVLWFMWFRETKTIPMMLEGFEKQRNQLMESFRESIKQEREDCERRHQELHADNVELIRAVQDLHQIVLVNVFKIPQRDHPTKEVGREDSGS